MFEEYLRKLGRNKKFWDDRFLGFLLVTDPEILAKLTGKDSNCGFY